MDSKGKMPHIKSDVNKLDDKKKSAGLLATLFGGGSSAGGLGGLGGGAAAGGGMLATKAGMIGLLVIGSAVAGSVGMVGYKVFGPGDSDQIGGNLALFAPKPKDAEGDPNAVAPVAKDGSSASLDYIAQAAAKDRAADAAAAGSEQSSAAGGSASSSDSSATGAAGAINSGSGGRGSLGSMGKALANAKKMGELSKGGSSGAATSATASAIPVSAGQTGSVSAFRATGGRASASTGRAIASRIGGANARNQLGQVSRDQRGAGSSMAAGHTYDGAARGGSAIGPNGTAIGMDGAGLGGEAQPKSISKNSAANVNEQSPPIPKPVHVVVPWEKAVARAQMLVGVAMALALLASTLGPSLWAYYAKMVIGAAISMIGAYIMTLGAQTMTGAYGQPLQGSVVIAAGIGVTLMGVMTIVAAEAPKDPSKVSGATSNPPANNTPGGGFTEEGVGLMPGQGASGTPPAAASASPATAASPTSPLGFLGSVDPMVLLGGGIASVAAIGLMMMPKPKPVEVPEGQKGPDVSYHQIAPPQNYWV